MTAVPNELRREMLERELHGIDVELAIKRQQHQIVTAEIDQLERDRADIQALLDEPRPR